MATKPDSRGKHPVRTNSAPVRTDSDELRAEFARLASSWKTGSHRAFDVAQMIEHPDYQRIIELGEQAVPLILEELARETDHWFPALRQLTRTSPVPADSRGNPAQMREAWLRWGRDHGLI